MRVRTLLLATLLCGESCGDDTTVATHADLSMPADLGIGVAMCPTSEPRSGDRCASGPNFPACTYGTTVCLCGGEGSWSCSPHD
jgi:hypothetical protein